MYNLEQLRMFVETVEAGSFSACARRLNKVPSAVSQGVANLEIDLNMELFDRSGKTPLLTKDGEKLLTYARSVLQQIEEMDAVAKGVNQRHEPLINIAIEDALITPKLCKTLNAFGDRFKATTVNIITVASPDITKMVKNNEADIGLMFLEIDLQRTVTQYFIGNIPFYGVAHPNSPLTAYPSISLNDLVPHRQIMLRGKKGNGLDLIPQLSTEIWFTNSFNSMRELVTQNIGWAYLPSTIVDDAINKGDLAKLPLSFDHQPWNPPVEIILTKNGPQGPALMWLSNELKNLLSQP